MNGPGFESSFPESGSGDIETILSWTEIGSNGLSFYFEKKGFFVGPAQSLFYSSLEKKCLDSVALKENVVETVESYMSLASSEGHINPRLKTNDFVNYDLPVILDVPEVSVDNPKNLCYIMFQVFTEAASISNNKHSSENLIGLFRKISSNISEIDDPQERDNYLVTLRNFVEHDPKYYSNRMGVNNKFDILSDAVYKSKSRGHKLSELKPDTEL